MYWNNNQNLNLHYLVVLNCYLSMWHVCIINNRQKINLFGNYTQYNPESGIYIQHVWQKWRQGRFRARSSRLHSILPCTSTGMSGSGINIVLGKSLTKIMSTTSPRMNWGTVSAVSALNSKHPHPHNKIRVKDEHWWVFFVLLTVCCHGESWTSLNTFMITLTLA